jgi:hypothetical protein
MGQLRQTCVLEQSLGKAGELIVRHGSPPSAIEKAAESGDPVPSAAGVEDETFEEVVPRRKRATPGLVECGKRAEVIVDDGTHIEDGARDARYGDAKPCRFTSQLIGECFVVSDTGATTRPPVPGHRHVDDANRSEAVESPQVCAGQM